jgi:hypothetical protein
VAGELPRGDLFNFEPPWARGARATCPGPPYWSAKKPWRRPWHYVMQRGVSVGLLASLAHNEVRETLLPRASMRMSTGRLPLSMPRNFRRTPCRQLAAAKGVSTCTRMRWRPVWVSRRRQSGYQRPPRRGSSPWEQVACVYVYTLCC